MSDQILNGCAPVKTMKDAQKAIVTPLLPVKGLRHDEKGDLTADALKTVIAGLTSLGIKVETETAQQAILLETQQALCNINAQYQYLLSALFVAIRNNDPISAKLIEHIQNKNMAMRDILSVSRQILETVPAGNRFVEGWTDVNPEGTDKINNLKAFSNLKDKLINDDNSIKEKRFSDLMKENFATKVTTEKDEERSFEISEERTKSVSANLALYSFLNVIAVGLLFYIVST
jgi:hypothetical protein